MTERLSVLERLEFFAEEGETKAGLILWKRQIIALEKGGFTVKTIAQADIKNRFYCIVNWEQPHGKDALKMLEYTLKALEANLKEN